MTEPAYNRAGVTIHCGDCREVLKSLPDESVNCCVTSPPYWGLRDYGTATWAGGSAECDHRKPATGSDPTKGSTLGGGKKTTGHSQESWGDKCRKCGATRIDQQLGLERTPDLYIESMVSVFREVRRVLRDDGTLWLNLGDTYNAYNGGAGPGSKLSKTQTDQRPALETGYGLQCKTLKPKDLVGIPWRVALALQADGWWLRQDIIWHKPNPMPESVRDRCTKAHEYIFLLSKSRRYHFDADAIKEESKGKFGNWTGGNPCPDRNDNLCQNMEHQEDHNRRSVWMVATRPFKGAHFAVFPSELITPCILAGCPAGGTVLDPFGGSGTTAEVAKSNGRNAVMIELNQEYVPLIVNRLKQGVLNFAE